MATTEAMTRNPGAVVDAGDQLGLAAVGEADPAHDVQLPQLHRRFPLPASPLAPVLLLLLVDQAVTDQDPVDRRLRDRRRDALLAQFECDALRAPARVVAAHLAGCGLHRGRHLRGRVSWSARSIHQARKLFGLVAP